MENRQKLKFVLTAASLAVISIFFTVQYGKRRKQKLRSSSCYLHTEVKPQHSFKRSLADNSYAPFRHLKRKESDDNNSASLHPYEAEIMDCLSNPPVDITNITKIKDLSMKEAYVWIETETQLKELADVLAKETVFSVDTEQHSQHSFLGFTALLQISTSEEDYLIDTIVLHDVMGILCPVFSNPSICKVFHGADNDVLWLQRDFHIYVVNLFDTAKACDVLSKPARSLAYLLETYCNVNTNKLLQREDWRQRPLSMEMVQYARTDAHYLLYIANCLIVELKQHNSEESSGGGSEKLDFVLEAYRRSNMTCLQLYGKDMEASPGESAASSIITRHGESSIQFQNIVRRLCAWREIMARVHDESLRIVLSDQAIVSLAEKMPVTPVEIFDLITHADLSIESPGSSFPSPSPIVCSHMENLCQLFEEFENLDNDVFSTSLQKCLGENGSCPLSIFNFPLLVHSTVKLTNKIVSRNNGNRRSRQLARKTSRQLFVQKFSCKSPVYHNCRIYADDGRLLCYCDRRKLEWYLRRNLAKLVENDPPAIMLLFEPKGRPEDEDNDFYIQSKKNICVGCGEGNHYLRYRIIPSCYRMHFPEHLKSHRSHDIVLVCVDCHEAAHAAAEKYKRKIATEYGIPLFVRNIVGSNDAQAVSEMSALGVEFEQSGVSPLELRTAAMALIRHGQRMPQKRREELIEIVKKFYGGRDISDEDLEKAVLVGMSSHERRRFKKKRQGLSLKYIKLDVDDNDPKNGVETEVPLAAFDDSVVDQESHASDEAENGVDDVAEADVENGTAIADVAADPDNTEQAESTRPRHNSKLSLLGHGPHGRQVVDRILAEQGEEGIRDFCQRWRQVFVKAVNPRFLPGGWDVKHSGRRDFGEFSVYNPVKKETIACAD